MSTLSRRQKSILKALLDAEKFITIKSLATISDVSERTVRNDLDFIADFLNEKAITLNRKSNKGIRVECSFEEKLYLNNELDELCDLQLDKTTRTYFVYLYLLCVSKSTYDKLAELCKVSRQTIINDFSEVEKRLINEGINVIKLPGTGVSLECEELKLRKVFEKNIRSLDDEELLNMLIQIKELSVHLPIVITIVERIQRHISVRFVQREVLIPLIAYNIYRSHNGYTLENYEVDKQLLKNKYYNDIDSILELASVYSYDKLYLCELILTSNMEYLSDISELDYSGVENEMAKYLFEKLEEVYPIDIGLKEALFQGLSTHLRAAIYRSKNQIKIKNEMLDQIKISIPLIYQFTAKELHHLEKMYNLNFEPDEIAYIAMYIASAFENSYKLENMINILLVCSYGLATSSILKSRVSQLITNCNLIGPISHEESEKYLNEYDVDLVISTHKEVYGSVLTLVVSPLLYGEDMERIKESIFQLSYSQMYNSFIKSYGNYENNQVKNIKLKDLVKKEDIQIKDRCDNWREAIRLSAAPLVNKGKLEKSYVEKMIDAVDRFGTYMVLVQGTAFIHAGTSDGINEDCTSVLILKRPVLLGDTNPKSVRNFVVLGIQNKEDNSLINLVYVFENEENLKRLQKEDLTVDDVYQLSC